jgi:NADH:ubiquinone reductase (non-electrogenic)
VSNTFKIPGVEEHALFLKELGDARRIRKEIIHNLERASIPGISDEERMRLLHFVVVGGGPTGVEFAAEMHDFVSDDLMKSYPSLVSDVRITLLEATNKILSTFDEKLSEYASRIFQRQHIEIRTESIVTRVDEREIILRDGSPIPFGLVVWSTGNTQTEFVSSQQLPKNPTGRILTNRYFQITGYFDIFIQRISQYCTLSYCIPVSASVTTLHLLSPCRKTPAPFIACSIPSATVYDSVTCQ